MRSWAELEAAWFQNAGNRQEDTPSFTAATTAKELILALLSLHHLTEDRRFTQAMQAVLDHELIDFKKQQFKKNWKSAQTRRLEDQLCNSIEDLFQRGGFSIRNACAELAADTPINAASFSAAVKKLSNLHARWAATNRPSIQQLSALVSPSDNSPRSKIRRVKQMRALSRCLEK